MFIAPVEEEEGALTVVDIDTNTTTRGVAAEGDAEASGEDFLAPVEEGAVDIGASTTKIAAEVEDARGHRGNPQDPESFLHLGDQMVAMYEQEVWDV